MSYNQGLYIDTSAVSSESLDSLKSPSGLQALPSFQLSPSPDIQSKPPKMTSNADIARDRMDAEKRKALAFLIGQLQNRPRVPSAFEAFRSTLTPRGDKRGFSPIASLIPAPGSFSTLRARDPNTSPGTSGARDSDDEDEGLVNSQYALCGQVAGMCNFLINSSRDGWQGLNQTYTAHVEPKSPTSSSPFRRRGSDVNPSNPPANPTSSSTLLSQCIAVLASLVSEDCRLPPPRPTVRRPPYTLHAHTLDFATALAETQFHNPGALVEIGFAMIPAFGTFPPSLLNRLVRLFENDLLRPMLNRLRSERVGGKDGYDLVRGHHPDVHDEPGMISIHVDEAGDADGPTIVVPQAHQRWKPWSSESDKSDATRLISSAASRQSRLIYRLSSLIGPLLSALFNVPNLSLHLTQLELAYEVSRLLDMVVQCKPDAYVDVLEVLAFHTSDSRPFSAGVLGTFWPSAFGHVFVGSPLPTFNYREIIQPSGPHPLAHQFMIWRFSDVADAPHSDCQACNQSINGLGLLCPFCMCCVHMNCYDNPDGTFIRPTQNHNQQRAGATRTNPVLKFSRILPTRRGDSFAVYNKGHRFNLANLFTLTLCAACQKPLWGTSMQAYICAGCGVTVHRHCVNTCPTCRPAAPQPHHSVDLQTLRRSFVDFYGKILWPESDLMDKSYEELSTAYCVLWTQLQTLRLGLQNFTINVEAQVPGAPKEEMADFELHYLVRLYQAQLSALRYDMSPVLKEFLHPRASVADHMIMYDWSLLAYIASLIKTPLDDPADEDLTRSPSHDLLSATTSTFDRDGSDDAPHAFEVVELAHLRDVLGHELQLASDRAAVEVLQHVSNLGFFMREDGSPCLDASVESKLVRCTFPLPIALDVNGDHVETLVSAIEACLDDLNVTINEVGFLLLVRRCWPSSRHTDYALSRLARVVLQWIFAEDDRLVVVARDYDRPGIPVPGVPAPTDVYPWPKGAGLQEAQRVSSYYVGYRRFLLQRYALRWLRALHDQDPGFYATTMFTHATDLAAEMDQLEQTDDSEEAKVDNMVARADQILKLITKLCQSSVIFSTFDAVMLQWLEAITSLCMLSSQAIVFRSLPRLCNPETDRTSVSLDNMPGVMADRFPTIDLWRVVDETAQKGGDDLLQALQWMRIMAQSGVDIPMSTFKQLAGVIRDNQCPLPQAMTLVEAMVAAAWLRPMRKQALQRLISHMHARYCNSICEEFKSNLSPASLIQFIRQSMAVCLLLAGCERDKIAGYGLLEKAETEPLPLRRTTANTRNERPDPLDSDLIANLVRYVTEGPETVSAYVAAFFTLLLAEPNLFDPQELQELVILNGHALSLCAWHLYDIQLHTLSVLRMKFLLHVLVVDAQPVENLLTEIFSSPKWELRFQALTRLFRVVLDVTNPQFYVDGQQWKSAIAPVFVYFFEAMWADERETIKLAADTWLQTLLPAHMEAIAACWDAYVSSAPISGRARLIAFLIQLQPHFPKWQTLTWATIEVLLDTLYSEDESFAGQVSGYGFPSSTSMPTLGQDKDATKQRISLLALALLMIANGVMIPVKSLLKLKQHLVRMMGFANVELATTAFGNDYYITFRDLQELPESAHPCMNPLLKVLDAAERIKYPLSSMGVESETDPLIDGLVGEIFVDVSLRVLSNATNLSKLPYVVQRALIEALIVIIHKHDVEHNQALKHLQPELRNAVRAVTDLLVLDASYDIRHLALTTALVFLKRHPKLCTKIINHQVYTVVTLLSGLKPSNEDMLVIHGRNFLTTAFSQFTNNGLFWNLAKKPLSPSVFSVLQVVLHDQGDAVLESQHLQAESMKDLVLRSTLTLALDQSDEVAIPTVLSNLNLFVELVHHQDLSADMIQLVGTSLSNFARQTAEWDSLAFDPNPLLMMTATIVLHNRAQSRELLAHLEVFLRAALGRFNVDKESIEKMLQVASAFARRGGSSNLIAVAILDVLSDALHGKARMSTVTLRSVTEMLSLQPLGKAERQLFPADQIVQAAADAVLYLCTMSVPERYQQSDVYAFLSTAGLVIRAAAYDLGFLPVVISSTRMRVRTWNLLILQALREASSHTAAQLFGHLQMYAQTFEMELQNALVSAASATFPSPGIIGDVTHAATGVRLWLLLARRRFMVEPQADSALEDMAVMYGDGSAAPSRLASRVNDSETNVAEWRVWNELWPALERFARALVVDEGIVASGTVADLAWAQLVDLVHFVRVAQSAVAMESSTFSALLEKMRSMPLEKSLSSKLARTVNAFDQPTVPMAYDALVAQTADQLWIAEKAYSAGSIGKLGGARRDNEAARRRLGNATGMAVSLDPVTSFVVQKTFG